MDESFQEIEAELKALKPQRPAARLLARIECGLAVQESEIPVPAGPRYTSATNLDSWKWSGWRASGLAAALAFLAMLGVVQVKRPAPAGPAPLAVAANPGAAKIVPVAAAPSNSYQPVTATNVLYDLKDEGPVYGDGDMPAHRMRYRYLDTYTWKSPRGNASLKWSVPRDEIRVLPVSMN